MLRSDSAFLVNVREMSPNSNESSVNLCKSITRHCGGAREFGGVVHTKPYERVAFTIDAAAFNTVSGFKGSDVDDVDGGGG